MASLTDREYLRRVRRGDRTAFGALLNAHWVPVQRYAAAVLGEGDAAEDVAQEVFVRLWERRRRLKLEGSVRGLLIRIARNVSLDELRRRSARSRAESRALEALPSESREADCEADELAGVIARAIEALPRRRREVFLLVRHHGLSYAEVADALELAPQTVANHMSMALADLRAALAPHYTIPISGRPTALSSPVARAMRVVQVTRLRKGQESGAA